MTESDASGQAKSTMSEILPTPPSTDAETPMEKDPLDHEVCLCFHVSIRKMQHFIEREKPTVPSQLSQCLDAGTGCRWCVPFLCKMHRQWKAGEAMDLPVSPEEYAERRGAYRRAGVKNDRLDSIPPLAD